MKNTKYILLFSFSLLLIGILSKSIFLFTSSSLIMIIGLMIFLVAGVVYGIMALVAKQFRIEAGMIALAFPLVAGIIFSLLYWPMGGVLIVMGSGILVIGSLVVLLYCLAQNRNVPLGVFYLAIGLGSLFFCFKFMRWPGADVLFIPVGMAIIAAIGILIVKRVELTISKIVSLIVIGLILLVYISSNSQLYYIKHLNKFQLDNNFPENYYTYAWILNKEGKREEAKVNLKIALREVQNPNNIQSRKTMGIADTPDANFKRYERALKQVNENNWTEFEKAEFNPF